MTRKQALETAVLILKENPDTAEASEVLRSMIEEMPFTFWSDETIRDSVDQFIADRGRVPIPSDFGKKPLPPHTVIRNRYKVTCGQWLRQNYPLAVRDHEKKREEVTRKFAEEYRRIGPVSAKKFDQRRNPSVPCSATVCRHHGNIRWSELLKKLELPVSDRKPRMVKEKNVTVTIQTDFQF